MFPFSWKEQFVPFSNINNAKFGKNNCVLEVKVKCTIDNKRLFCLVKNQSYKLSK
jgi:hypothetical protein